MNEIDTIWKGQMITEYKNNPIYQLAQDSGNTSRGGKMQHYCIRNGLLHDTT